MRIDGGCHCGRICYEAEVDPSTVLICHCTDCQTLSGSAFRTVVPTTEGTFKLLSGTPKVYVKTGESGTNGNSVLPRLRYTNLFGPCRRWPRGGELARRHHSPAGSDGPDGPVLVSLSPGVAQRIAVGQGEKHSRSSTRKGASVVSTTPGPALPFMALSDISQRCEATSHLGGAPYSAARWLMAP